MDLPHGCSLTTLPATLDDLRLARSIDQGCNAMIVVWNKSTGERRRQSLLAQGFRTLDHHQPHPDGAFGSSFILFRPLPWLASQLAHSAPIYTNSNAPRSPGRRTCRRAAL